MTNTLIGRYEIIRELGAGGMAVVYLAQDPFMKRQVAVKVLPRQFTFDPQFRSRFQREAQVIAGLEHPAIVPVYDYGDLDDQPYIVMRFMPGGSLADRMAKAPLTLTEIHGLFRRLASALDAAHASGLVHRDLKPANILFDQTGETYLSDFGIVKMAEAHSAYTGSAIIGTPPYMSPEQAKGKTQVDGRSDVYSLGVILYELLSKQLPFVADTPMGQAVAHIIEPVPDILQANPALPPACRPIIERVLAKNPADRYPTAGALAEVVGQLASNPKLFVPPPVITIPAKPPTPLPPALAAKLDPKSVADQPDRKRLPPSSGRPSTGQTILQQARSPWAIAFTGAGALLITGVALAVCVGGAFAISYFRATPTATPSLTPAEGLPATGTATPTVAPTETVIASETTTFTETATPTKTASTTLTPSRTRVIVTRTPTATVPILSPTPNCVPPEFFDPFMNCCRIHEIDSATPIPSGDGGSGNPLATPGPTAVPTCDPDTACSP